MQRAGRPAFHRDLVEALYPAAAAVGFDLTLSATTPDRDEEHAAEALLNDRCEALILVGPQAPAAWLEALYENEGERVRARLTPYHQWANRSPATMRVWLPIATRGAAAQGSCPGERC